jgi:hypothetical protein
MSKIGIRIGIEKGGGGRRGREGGNEARMIIK